MGTSQPSTPCALTAAYGLTVGDLTVHACGNHVTDALLFLAGTVMCYPLKRTVKCGAGIAYPRLLPSKKGV